MFPFICKNCKSGERIIFKTEELTTDSNYMFHFCPICGKPIKNGVVDFGNYVGGKSLFKN